MKASSLILSAAALAIPLGLSLPRIASAQEFTFTGTGDWFEDGNPNWSPDPASTGAFNNGFFNVAGRNATINGDVNYNPGGDFLLGNGNSMVVDGGSWTQGAAAGAWVQIGSGATTGTGASVTLRNGGTFANEGGGQLRIGTGATSNTTFTVESTGGGITATGETSIGETSTLNIQGGTNSFANVTGPGSLTVSGGNTTASAVQLVSGSSLTVSGGDLTSSGVALVSGSSLTVSGGNLTASNTFTAAAGSSVSISGGSLTKTTGNVTLESDVPFSISGNGNLTLSDAAGEFQPGGLTAAQGISGSATLDILGITAFQGGDARQFDISDSATITIGGSGFNGIFSSGGYYNFTASGTGSSILFTGTGNGGSNIDEGSIRFQNTIYTLSDPNSPFIVTNPTAGSTLITTVAVPEPSVACLVLLGGVGAVVARRRRKLATA